MVDLCEILIISLTTAGLFVVVSWISFVVPPDVIPGRMALLITLFLVLVNIFNTVTTNTPKAEGDQHCSIEKWIFNVSTGLTAIETWMLSCLLFVFGALVGITNYYDILKFLYNKPRFQWKNVFCYCKTDFQVLKTKINNWKIHICKKRRDFEKGSLCAMDLVVKMESRVDFEMF